MREPVAVLGVEPDQAQQVSDPLRPARLAPGLVDLEGLGDDVVDGQLRVQRGVRVLEDDLQVATHGPHLSHRHRGQLLPLEADGARRRRVQLQQRPAGRRLSAAGLADDAEGLARVDVEGHAAHRLDVAHGAAQQAAAADREVHDELVHLQQVLGPRAPLGRRRGAGLCVGGAHVVVLLVSSARSPVVGRSGRNRTVASG